MSRFARPVVLFAVATLVALAAPVVAQVPAEIARVPASTSRACEGGCETGLIQAAVDAASPGDTIWLAPGNHADNVVIDKRLTIRGAGPEATRVWGRARDSVFIVRDAVVTLADMTITNGAAPRGGGVFVEGLAADVHLENCHILDNHADAGGAVYSADGSVTITTNTISGNVAGWVGGVVAYGGDLAIRGSSIIGNFGQHLCGVYAIADGSEMDLSIVESTISDNESGSDWGYTVEIFSFDSPLRATISNTTISNNTAGGVGFSEWYNLLEAEIAYTTIHGNGLDPANHPYGLDSSSVNIAIRGSIIAGNHGSSQCRPRGYSTSLGGNISGDASCDFNHPADLEDTDPLLLPLADNGGPTPTHALDPASPAIDFAGLVSCLPTDQRGIARPQDGDGDGIAACDSGAFEAELPFLPVEIDILPRIKQNRIDLQTRRAIRVAVLGSETFDVTEIDVESLRFGPKQTPPLDSGNGVFLSRIYPQDFNGDGHDDLVAGFLVRGAGIACGDEAATLSGETYAGEPFQGADMIETINCMSGGGWPRRGGGATEFGRLD